MVKKNWKLAFTIIATPLFLSMGEAFALMNTYPTLGGITLTDDSSFGELAMYLFILFLALGTMVLFVLVVINGVKMITGGTFSEEIKKFKGSLIGFSILLASYLIINSINGYILEIKEVSPDCMDGFHYRIKMTVETENGGKEEIYKKVCIKGNDPQLPDLVEKLTADMTPCSYKAIIAYPEADYQGTPVTLFNDSTTADAGCPIPDIDLRPYKSVKILPKLFGLYLYDADDVQTYLGSEIDDLTKIGFKKDGVEKIEVLNRDYNSPPEDPLNKNNKIRSDYYYGVAFQSPESRGTCEVFDADKEYSLEEISTLLTVRSRVKETEEKDSYIYLYPVVNCGKTVNEDENKTSERDFNLSLVNNVLGIDKAMAANPPKCGSSSGKKYTAPPTANLCESGVATAVTEKKDGATGKVYGWEWKCKQNRTSVNEEVFPDVTCSALFAENGIDPSKEDPGEAYKPYKLTDLEALKMVCKIKVPQPGTSAEDLEVIIKDECGDFLKNEEGEFYDVVSIKVDALAALVIRSTNDQCLYFSRNQIERSGGCIGDLTGSDVFDTRIGKDVARPKSIVIMTNE